MTRLSILATSGIFAAYAAVSYAVLQQVNMNVPNAYMDEIFHIPQAQHYCQGNFHVWDPKLTTPPGLYLFSTLLNRILGHLCSVSFLRHTNWITSLVLFWIIRDLQGQLRPGAQLALKSLSLALFPVTFFLNHLYYTDTLSLALVLGMYAVSLRDRHWAAGGLGFLSLWVRQTNVIWVVFVASTVALRQVHGSVSEQMKSLALWCLSKRAVVLVPYAMVVALFAGFVAVNGGIVLGDKENHRAGMHLPQILYLFAYIVGVSAPALVPIVSPLWFVRSISKRPVRSLTLGLVLGVAMTYSIRYYTVEHPFLLSDNRHYPFYLWKTFFRRYSAAKYLAIPFYIYASSALHTLLSRESTLWQLSLLLCTCLVIVPSPLLEFRYFTIPYYIVRMHSRSSHALWEIMWFGCINFVTLWVFLYRPFAWDSEPGVLQRFMW